MEDDNTPVNSRKIHKVEFSVNKIKENYKMKHIKPSLYYYKRWIWIQFPWVCISLNNNYSVAPEFCKQLEGEDIDTYEHESKYTKQALIIAIEAKEKKKMMFTKKSDDLNGFVNVSCAGRSKIANPSTAKSASRANMRSKVFQRTFTTVDLSLNTLTK